MKKFQLKNEDENNVKLFCNEKKDTMIATDIEVAADVESVTFSLALENGRYLQKIDLLNNEKVFPNVKTVNIESNAIFIPNAMFPNATEVKSFSDKAFKNVFYSDENSVIDLKNCTSIEKCAFKGCKTTKIINSENIKQCAKTAFDDSAFMEQPFVNGVKMAGTILIDIDNNADNIIFPANMTHIMQGLKKKFTGLNKITIYNKTILESILWNIGTRNATSKIAKTIVLGNDYNFSSYRTLISLCESLELTEDNEVFSVHDGILYSSKFKTLIICPRYKTGKVEIPKGVITIKSTSFNKALIESVSLPNTVSVFEPISFVDCPNLKEIIFEDGIELLTAMPPSGMIIENCKNLKTLSLPKTLKMTSHVASHCPLTNLELPEGLKVIGHQSFEEVYGAVKIPDSVVCVNKDNFTNTKHIISSNYLPGLFQLALIDNYYDVSSNDSLDYTLYTIEENDFYIYPGFSSKGRELMKELELADNFEDIIDKIDILSMKVMPSTAAYTIALLNYEQRKSKYIEDFIIKKAKDIGKFHIIKNNYDMFVKLLKTNLVSSDVLKELLAESQALGNTLASAYLLNELKDNNIKVDLYL